MGFIIIALFAYPPFSLCIIAGIAVITALALWAAKLLHGIKKDELSQRAHPIVSLWSLTTLAASFAFFATNATGLILSLFLPWFSNLNSEWGVTVAEGLLPYAILAFLMTAIYVVMLLPFRNPICKYLQTEDKKNRFFFTIVTGETAVFIGFLFLLGAQFISYAV